MCSHLHRKTGALQPTYPGFHVSLLEGQGLCGYRLSTQSATTNSGINIRTIIYFSSLLPRARNASAASKAAFNFAGSLFLNAKVFANSLPL